MNRILRALVALPGIFFVVMGLRWLVDPAGAAGDMDMELLDGIGRSTQIGDLATFFLAVGMMILVGLITSQRRWFHVPALMLLGTAIFRVLAWLLHDAALAGQLIALELVVACLLLFAASRLTAGE
jgi:fatty acid desaturase